MKPVQIIAIVFLLIIISDFLLLIFGRIDALLFWIVAILCAIVAYVLIPKLNK